MLNRNADAPMVIVGAGIAGLSCARALVARGKDVLVLDRARGVGGRCATRRFEEQPVDFGVAFLHGRDPAFLEALAAVDATPLPGWPAEIHGAGRPCQPEAFSPDERRLAFAEGVNVFPRHLARGLHVRTDARVTSASFDGGAVHLAIEGAAPIVARTVVFALAGEQTAQLLSSMDDDRRELAAARALLGMVAAQPCLTLIAGYPLDAPVPTWHVSYPEASKVVQILAHDSSKRARKAFHAMVIQAHPRWSRAHIEDEGWPAAILAEAGRLLGPWATAPRFTQAHRWRYARTDRGAELSGPLLLHLPGGARLGFAGELFAPGGGIEAAWLSGRRLATRIEEE